jgi:hypothetical protein
VEHQGRVGGRPAEPRCAVGPARWCQ